MDSAGLAHARVSRAQRNDDREKIFNRHGIKDGRCRRYLMATMQLAMRVVKSKESLGVRTRGDNEVLYDFRERGSEIDAAVIGGQMEDVAGLIKVANIEAEESRATLQRLKKDVDALSDILQPALIEHSNQIRSARMTVVSEVNAAMTAMREVRKFFLESNYDVEMERLERFVRVCHDIQKLQADGVFDAVCDAAVRLAVQETK